MNGYKGHKEPSNMTPPKETNKPLSCPKEMEI